MVLRRHRQAQIAERLTAGPNGDGRDLVFTDEQVKPYDAKRAAVPPLSHSSDRRGPPIRFHDLATRQPRYF